MADRNSTISDGTDAATRAAAVQQLEVEKLTERLRVSDEWNVRLQNQIQELLRLPRNEVMNLRERMNNPDIALPLLQCYDATIAEKTETIEQLRTENTQCKSKLETLTAEQSEWSNAVRVAEDLAKHVQGQAGDEVKQLRRANESLQQELQQSRLEMTRALDCESAMKLSLEKAIRGQQQVETEVEKLRVEKVRLEEALRLCQSRLQAKQAADGEEEAQTETQRVQVHLLKKENEDKLQEIERLRSKMVLVLRQSADNHNSHLRIVEERHRQVVEELQSMNKTQELEVLKLRAQLARIDPANPCNAKEQHSYMSMKTTTELLDAQARQAQEMELKRMYTELSSLQIERDDAVLRYEQLSSNLRREHEMQLQEGRRERQVLQRKLDEYRARCDKLEISKYDVENQTVPLRERLVKAQSEAERTRAENTALQQRIEDARRKQSDAEIALAALKEELRTSLAAERSRADLLEQRVQEVLRDLQDAKDRATAETQQAVRERESLQRQYNTSVQSVQAMQNTLRRSEREVVSLQAQLERLGEALRLHKQQIKNNDDGAVTLQRELEQARLRERSHLLAVEQLKVENARLTRAQMRMAELPSTRVY